MENTWKRTGYIEGKQDGKLEGKLEDARLMPMDGWSVVQVCKNTGLSRPELHQSFACKLLQAILGPEREIDSGIPRLV